LEILQSKYVFFHSIGVFTNLNRHLNNEHSNLINFKRYLTLYNEQNSKHKKKYAITPKMLILIKYFITSNSALAEMNNDYFRYILAEAKYDAPGDQTFKKVVEDAYDLVKRQISEKLDEAIAVTLITDIWTNKKNEDYIAVSASLVHEGFVREVVTLGMQLMNGKHNAEDIKLGVENIVNYYIKFDKSKIIGIVSGEGSALIRLFKQITNDDLEGVDLSELIEDERYLLGILVDEFAVKEQTTSDTNLITAAHTTTSVATVSSIIMNQPLQNAEKIVNTTFNDLVNIKVVDEEIRNTLSLTEKMRFSEPIKKKMHET
jgi:hypothetical protein